MSRHKGNTFRNGKVHICAKQCPTCIFRPGNKMHMNPGRLKDMIEGATKANAAIICHDTLDGDNAVCRGFFNKHPTQTLQIAERLGYVEYVPVSKESRGKRN